MIQVLNLSLLAWLMDAYEYTEPHMERKIWATLSGHNQG